MNSIERIELQFVLIKQGAEAKIYSGSFHWTPCTWKKGFPSCTGIHNSIVTYQANDLKMKFDL